jgi:AcrR family transcriptional regulator
MRVESTRKRVSKPPDERRLDLLEAARKVFAEKGIPAATVSDVTEAAGVAKGTFYLYFESKEALLGALKERFVDDLIAHASSLLPRIGRDDWWALADSTVGSMFDFVLGNRDLIQVFAQEGLTPESRQVFADCEAKLVNMFAFAIQAGVEAGAFAVRDPQLTAAFLNHAFRGVLENSILYDREIDRGRLVDGAREFMRRALAP